jgi:hypothetical protein
MFNKQICLKCTEAWHKKFFGDHYAKREIPKIREYWEQGKVTCYYAGGSYYITEDLPDECIYLLEQTMANNAQ